MKAEKKNLPIRPVKFLNDIGRDNIAISHGCHGTLYLSAVLKEYGKRLQEYYEAELEDKEEALKLFHKTKDDLSRRLYEAKSQLEEVDRAVKIMDSVTYDDVKWTEKDTKLFSAYGILKSLTQIK